MDAPEVSLKLAQFTLQTKQADIISDIVKIGIPSLVALVGTMSTIVIAFKGHQKDLAIAQLSADKENDKEKAKLTAILIKEISNRIGDIHAVAIRYTTLYCSKIYKEGELANHTFPAMTELRERHSDLLSKLHDLYETETNVSLLGSSSVIELYHDFKICISGLCSKYCPHLDADYEDVIKETATLARKKHDLYRELSFLYLGKH